MHLPQAASARSAVAASPQAPERPPSFRIRLAASSALAAAVSIAAVRSATQRGMVAPSDSPEASRARSRTALVRWPSCRNGARTRRRWVLTPVGVQVTAGRYREDLCLLAGEAIEAGGVPPAPIDPVDGA